MQQNMRRKGTCSDNALKERFFRCLNQCLPYERLLNQKMAKSCIIDYIAFYNEQKIHASLAYKPQKRCVSRDAVYEEKIYQSVQNYLTITLQIPDAKKENPLTTYYIPKKITKETLKQFTEKRTKMSLPDFNNQSDCDSLNQSIMLGIIASNHLADIVFTLKPHLTEALSPKGINMFNSKDRNKKVVLVNEFLINPNDDSMNAMISGLGKLKPEIQRAIDLYVIASTKLSHSAKILLGFNASST